MALRGHEQEMFGGTCLQMPFPMPTWQGWACALQGDREALGTSPGCILGFPLLDAFLRGDRLSSAATLLSVP